MRFFFTFFSIVLQYSVIVLHLYLVEIQIVAPNGREEISRAASPPWINPLNPNLKSTSRAENRTDCTTVTKNEQTRVFKMTYPYMPTQETFSLYGFRTPDNPQGIEQSINAFMDAQPPPPQQDFQPSSTPFVQPPPQLPHSPPDSVQVSEGSHGHGHAYAGMGSGSGSGSGSGGVLDGIRSSESEEKEGELLEMDMSGEPDKRKAQNRAA